MRIWSLDSADRCHGTRSGAESGAVALEVAAPDERPIKTVKAGASVSDVREAIRTETIRGSAPNWPSALRALTRRVRRSFQRHPLPIFAATEDEPADEEPTTALDGAWGISFSAVAEITVNNGPIGDIVVSPDGNRLMVTNYGADSVSVIDTGRCAVTGIVVGTREPFAIAVGNNRAYVSCVSAGCDGVAVIDMNTGQPIAMWPVAVGVSDLAASPEGQQVYVGRTRVDGADVAVLDTTTERIDLIDLETAATAAECLSISPDGRRVYAATHHGLGGGELSVVDTRTRRVIDTIEIGSAIRDVALSSDGATAYVGSDDPTVGGLVDVVDTRTNEVTDTIQTHGLLRQLVLSHGGDRLFALNDDTVTALCTWTHEVIGSYRLSSQPSCLAESPDGKRLYVADYAGTVTALSVESTTASLVGEIVHAAMISPAQARRLELAMA